ncbi:DNA polymerase III subunit alpha [Aureimonas sp. AU40]|uniref:DNA polymerase III subunit alpha n=1 Tax=Aureimonas sp. AU40 TaxID=1637747 RepID=UPI000785F34F|nr:DNA polymerase III subunit alpha [Aureimonas sp. AU40]
MHTALAVRTDFSIGESILNPKAAVKAAKTAGQSVIAITDTMSVTSMIAVTNAAKDAGMKPVIGCRVMLVDDHTWKKSKEQKNRPEFYATVYVKTSAGLLMLYRLLSLANSDERFYYKPLLSFGDLMDALGTVTGDDVAVTTSDTHSFLRHPEADQIVGELVRLIGKENVYASIIGARSAYFDAVNTIAGEMVEKHGIQPLAVRPAMYGNGSMQASAREVMGAITNNNKLSDPWHKSPFNRDFFIMEQPLFTQEIVAAAKRMKLRGRGDAGTLAKAAIANTQVLVDSVSFEWSKSPVSLPQMAPDEFEAVKAECKKGWATRFTRETFGHCPTRDELLEVYKPRLAYELEVLKALNFSGYFLLVQDIVVWAKSQGIMVGPGRGSVGGSLVAYLMGITECDPIRFDLMFERFINPDRIDLPDADLDFMRDRRHEVFDYIIQKYGQERVAGVSNFGKLGAASSIRDVMRSFNRPEAEYRCSKYVPDNHGQSVTLAEALAAVPEIQEMKGKNESAWTIMEALEGSIRNMSQHAAGVVVGGCDLTERAVIERRKGASVVNWDKRIVEEQGLVKIDVLGLATLDQIMLTLDYIRERHPKVPDITAIPLDDEKVLANFAAARTIGIFQFPKSGARKLLRELGKDGWITFNDVTAASGLNRPGPIEAGLTESYYRRKQGVEDVEYDHQLMEPILNTTFGVMVYQEQIMKISVVIAGYTPAESDKLRKIMGKKEPAEMAKQRDKFVAGCVKTVGSTEAWGAALFDKIEGFAGYGFNLSHSVEYTLISYQAMFLKTYYPVEFFSAALTILDEADLPAIIDEAERMGIEVDVPDVNNSTARFEIVTDTRLVMPFQRVKGLTTRSADAIVTARESLPGRRFEDIAQFENAVNKRLVNKAKIETLNQIGAFARIEPGQVPSNDPSRIKAQIENLPGLITAAMPIDRDLQNDKDTRLAILGVVADYQGQFGFANEDGSDGVPVKPFFGKKAGAMVITDAPNWEEEQQGQMSQSKSSRAILTALENNELDRADVYWTGLIKRPKEGKQVSPEEIARYMPFLRQEIELLKPPVIALVGSQAVRTFMPDFKGKASDVAGKVVYSKEFDCNFVIGFNPGEIFFAPEKADEMDKVFASVRKLIGR